MNLKSKIKNLIFRTKKIETLKYEDIVVIKDENNYGICPVPTSSEEALKKLQDYLLGEDWYVSISMNQEQVNTCIVDAILTKYSNKYRKETKMLQKEEKLRRR